MRVPRLPRGPRAARGTHGTRGTESGSRRGRADPRSPFPAGRCLPRQAGDPRGDSRTLSSLWARRFLARKAADRLCPLPRVRGVLHAGAALQAPSAGDQCAGGREELAVQSAYRPGASVIGTRKEVDDGGAQEPHLRERRHRCALIFSAWGTAWLVEKSHNTAAERLRQAPVTYGGRAKSDRPGGVSSWVTRHLLRHREARGRRCPSVTTSNTASRPQKHSAGTVPRERLPVFLGVVVHGDQLGDELARPRQQKQQGGDDREAARLGEPGLAQIVVVQLSAVRSRWCGGGAAVVPLQLHASNGRVIASSEDYQSRAAALRSIESIRSNAAGAKLVDEADASPAGQPMAKKASARKPARKTSAKRAAAKRTATSA